MNSAANNLYRELPQVGEVLDSASFRVLLAKHSRALVSEAVRAALDRLRQEIKANHHSEETIGAALANLPEIVGDAVRRQLTPSLRRVINATGVVLQTNLGRAPLSEVAIQRIVEVARGYCNLEFDLHSGERSRRDTHAENLMLYVLALRAGQALDSLRETHAAAVVNNCAAATFLALNTLAEGGEVIVSRGELVEIGGGFRIPDILRKSGAVLREVGTTNRTRIADYAAAITPQTRLILRVHRSNFRMEGFTERPTLEELQALSVRTAVPVFDDQGTGCIVAPAELGISGESSWVESATSGVALVTASGDKLLGGPQCGLLVGARDIIERIRVNPLFRALRVDKLTYAALEGSLLAYLDGKEESLPAMAMIRLPAEAVRQRCEAWAAVLRSESLSAEILPTQSLIGGGTTPGATLPSYAVALRHAAMSEGALAALLRGLDPPIVARTSQGCVLLDLRTVFSEEDDEILHALQTALQGSVNSHTAKPQAHPNR